MATISNFTHLLAFLLGLALANLTTETSGHLRTLLGSRKKLLSSDSEDIARSRTLSAKTASDTPPDFHTGGDVILSRYHVEAAYGPTTWQRKAYDSFVCTLLEKSSIFPCIYATKGYKANEQRFVFLESENLSSPSNVSAIASALIAYLPRSRQLGPNTSLVVLCRPSTTPRSVQAYHDIFWACLKALHALDPKTWPTKYPEEINSDEWCFCFNNEPTFTVIQTPAHKQRQTRYAPSLRVVIQPKWIFDALFSSDKKRAHALQTVRALVKSFDSIAVSPDLKNFGEEGSRESQQYFLLDENVSTVCPYTTLKA